MPIEAFFRRRREKAIADKVDSFNRQQQELKVDASLRRNIDLMKELFRDVDIIRYRDIQSRTDNSLRCCLVFTDGMVDNNAINDNIVKPLTGASLDKSQGEPMDALLSRVIQIGETKTADGFKEIIEAVTYGDSILFVDGCREAAIVNTKKFVLRAVVEPESDRVISGPHEGFNESLMQNLSQLRRRVRTNELKIKYLTLGRRTQTAVAVCYFDSLVDHDILHDLLNRLNGIDIDAVLDANYITELIRDNPHSPFRSTGYAERPDSIVGKLLEGRMAILVDGSPVVLSVPYLFIENFQSAEDYYLNYYYTTFSRILRIAGFLITIAVPGFYIAMVAFQKEMLPTPLFISVVADRMGVPFPVAVEAFVMIVMFDILRETGIRMPSSIGQALSIVGALVIGQAAVTAKLVSAPMIIIVAVTGVANLMIPKLNAPVIYARLFILAISTSFGLYGFVLSLAVVFIHILNLTSMGIPQVSLEGNYTYQDMKDIAFRAPWWRMLKRPRQLTDNRTRQTGGKEDA